MDNFVQEYFAPTNDICGSKPAVLLPEEKSSAVDESGENDTSNAILIKFVSDLLMQEEEDKPSTVNDCLALQATEKSLYDVLMNDNLNEYSNTPGDRWRNACGGSSLDTSCLVESNFESVIVNRAANRKNVSQKASGTFMIDFESPSRDFEQNNENTVGYMELVDQTTRDHSRKKRVNRHRKASGFTEEDGSNRQLANNFGKTRPVEMSGNVVLCDNLTQNHPQKKLQDRKPKRRSYKMQIIIKDVDLTSLLMKCAQAVANFDCRALNDLLFRVRQHSSPQGDSTERLAYYLANALEARLVGTRTPLSVALNSKRITAADTLKVYRMFVTASPLANMSDLLANNTIMKLATEAITLHIIDFGVLLGYQWPSLIEALSERPGGPPKLRITGIDFPGSRPLATNTGESLANCCTRFGVPFEYNAIEQQWHTIRIEDLKISKNELLVVNCSYRLHHVPDETMEDTSPRDEVLTLIKKISPDMFIHGVINGTYNTPFFFARFKEALYYFSSMLDMFEATLPGEDEERLLFEEQILGRNAMNIIACEGTERIERPETYKQWQVRHLRVGFKQLSLDQEIVKHVRRKVKSDYHKDFTIEEDGKWMLLGWKGRVNRAISCWQPAQYHSS